MRSRIERFPPAGKREASSGDGIRVLDTQVRGFSEAATYLSRSWATDIGFRLVSAKRFPGLDRPVRLHDRCGRRFFRLYNSKKDPQKIERRHINK